MNLVDSCGWLEFFTDGKNAEFFSFPLAKKEQLVVPTVCVYEVFKKVLKDKDETSALHAITAMKQGIVVDLDERISLLAAKISIQNKIPMADSIILATARLYQAVVWTQDGHFKEISQVEYKIKRSDAI